MATQQRPMAPGIFWLSVVIQQLQTSALSGTLKRQNMAGSDRQTTAPLMLKDAYGYQQTRDQAGPKRANPTVCIHWKPRVISAANPSCSFVARLEVSFVGPTLPKTPRPCSWPFNILAPMESLTMLASSVIQHSRTQQRGGRILMTKCHPGRL